MVRVVKGKFGGFFFALSAHNIRRFDLSADEKDLILRQFSSGEDTFGFEPPKIGSCLSSPAELTKVEMAAAKSQSADQIPGSKPELNEYSPNPTENVHVINHVIKHAI